jgi:hypothetical protein
VCGMGLVLGVLLGATTGCRSMNVDKARARSSKLEPQMTLDEVYKLLGRPKEAFAGRYIWEYYWPGTGTGRLLRIEFEDSGGRWVVSRWEWR